MRVIDMKQTNVTIAIAHILWDVWHIRDVRLVLDLRTTLAQKEAPDGITPRLICDHIGACITHSDDYREMRQYQRQLEAYYRTNRPGRTLRHRPVKAMSFYEQMAYVSLAWAWLRAFDRHDAEMGWLVLYRLEDAFLWIPLLDEFAQMLSGRPAPPEVDHARE